MKKQLITMGLMALLALTPISVKAEENFIDYQTSITYSEETKENIDLVFLYLYDKDDKDDEDNWNKYLVVKDIETRDDYLIAEEVDTEMYVSARKGLNLRTFPNITYENVFKTLSYGTKVNVIGISEEGWYIIKYKDTEYFCWGEDYLSNKKPEDFKTSSNSSKVDYTEGQGTRSIGTWRLTAYCTCKTCNGKWYGQPTASGTSYVEGRTVACNELPFGTKISINGNIYVVEDRGKMKSNTIDIFIDSHSRCNQFGVQYAEVFIVE